MFSVPALLFLSCYLEAVRAIPVFLQCNREVVFG